jgi:hypothetical protein
MQTTGPKDLRALLLVVGMFLILLVAVTLLGPATS